MSREAPETFASRLREITRGIVVEIESPDPHVVASAVIDRLTPRQYKEALAVCLPDWVREVVKQSPRAKKAPVTRRTKSDWTRDWYADLLGKSMFNGSQWKFLRDFTADDLHAAAAERYRAATATHAEGDRWAKVALFMEENDRATVAQILPAELKQLMEEQ